MIAVHVLKHTHCLQLHHPEARRCKESVGKGGLPGGGERPGGGAQHAAVIAPGARGSGGGRVWPLKKPDGHAHTDSHPRARA